MVGEVASDELVTFVNDEKFDVVGWEVPSAEEVDESLRCSYEDVRRTLEERLDLLGHVALAGTE